MSLDWCLSQSRRKLKDWGKVELVRSSVPGPSAEIPSTPTDVIVHRRLRPRRHRSHGRRPPRWSHYSRRRRGTVPLLGRQVCRRRYHLAGADVAIHIGGQRVASFIALSGRVRSHMSPRARDGREDSQGRNWRRSPLLLRLRR